MIKVKVNNEYKDVVKIFCGGTLQKEIIKVWSREAQEYVYESSIEYTGSLPITINANGDVLIDYRIYGADGGVGEPTENLIDASLSEQTIEIKPSTEYALCKYISVYAKYLTYGIYDENDNQLWGDFLGSFTSQNIPVNANTKYFKISIPDQFLNAVSLVEGRTPTIIKHFPETYIPYGYKLPMTVQSANLFDYTQKNTEKGFKSSRYLVIHGAEGSYGGYQISEYIAIHSETSYYLSDCVNNPARLNSAALCFYDKNYQYLSGITYGDNASLGFVSPPLAKFIRFTYYFAVEKRTALFEQHQIPVYIGENQLGEGEYVDYGEQKIYKRTENLFELLDDMKDAKNWEVVFAITAAYFIYYHLSPEQLTRLKNVGTVYGKSFKKEGGQYINGMVLAITNTKLYTGVTDNMRLIYRDGAIANYSHDFTQDLDAYLCIGYGPGITEETKQFFVNAILNNFDIMLSSTAPTEYVPYLQPTDPPIPLPEIPTIDGTTIIDYDREPKPSQMYVKYRR